MAGVVLLIDDDFYTRDILRTLLVWKGLRVLECDNADQGLRLAEAERPNVIVTEFMIPARGEGRCVVEELRDRTDTAEIPALVFTVNALPEVRDRVTATGASYLQKPADSRAVLNIIERLAASVRA